jgi:hypothetical protein
MVETIILNSIKPEGYTLHLIGEDFLNFLVDGLGRVFFKKGKLGKMKKIGKRLPPFPEVKVEESIKVVSFDFEVEEKLRNSLSINRPAFGREEGELLSGFSGVQPKNRVVASQKGVKTPGKGELSNALLKYESYFGITLVEHILLRVAERMGFPTPASFVIVDQQLEKSPFLRSISTGLVVERFDNQEGTIYYDLMEYLKEKRCPNLKDKYDLTIEELFQKVEKILPEGEVQLLAKYFYFNYLAKNGDLHLKNIGLMEKNGQIHLSPFYDIVNTAVYGFKTSLGLKLSPSCYKEEFSERELGKVLAKYLTPVEREEIIEQFREEISTILPQLNLSSYPNGEKIGEELRKIYLPQS